MFSSLRRRGVENEHRAILIVCEINSSGRHRDVWGDALKSRGSWSRTCVFLKTYVRPYSRHGQTPEVAAFSQAYTNQCTLNCPPPSSKDRQDQVEIRSLLVSTGKPSWGNCDEQWSRDEIGCDRGYYTEVDLLGSWRSRVRILDIELCPFPCQCPLIAVVLEKLAHVQDVEYLMFGSTAHICSVVYLILGRHVGGIDACSGLSLQDLVYHALWTL